MVALTIGVIAADDLAVLSHCLNSLRFSQDLTDTELFVLNRGVRRELRTAVHLAGGRYAGTPVEVGLAGAWNYLFALADGDAVLCLDATISLGPAAVRAVIAHFAANPMSPDLVHGVRLDPDFVTAVTHLVPRAVPLTGDPTPDEAVAVHLADLPGGAAFVIPGHDSALFACRRTAWPGLSPLTRGDAGLGGHLATAFRQRGGDVRCLPSLFWAAGADDAWARAERNASPARDALRNAVLARSALGLDLTPAIRQAGATLAPDSIAATLATARAEVAAHAAALTDAGPPPSAVGAADVAAGAPQPAPHPGAGVARTAGAAPAVISRAEPLISCLCPTFNRPSSGRQWLVEEAIESFLRQDYPHKELVILNDTPGQTLTVDAPGVRIINEPARYPSIGGKRNALVSLARGDHLCFWDDDDIILPWRLSLSLARLGTGAYFNPRAHWQRHGDNLLPVPHGDNCAVMSLFTRAAFVAMDGMPPLDLHEDTVLDHRLSWYSAVVHRRRTAGPALPMRDWFYLYRLGVSDTHLSTGLAGAWARAAARPIQPGRVVLRPHWRADYVALVRAAAARHDG